MSHVETGSAIATASTVVWAFELPVTPQQFANGLRTVHYATDPDSTRYALGSVQVIFADDRITFTATDSRRLATFHIPCSGKAEPEPYLLNVFDCRKLFRAINSTAGETLHLIAHSKGSEVWVEFALEKRCKGGEVQTVCMRCDIVEGRFPRWQDVIPQRGMFRCKVSTTTGCMGETLPEDWGTGTDFKADEFGLGFTPSEPGTRLVASKGAIEGEVSTTLDCGYVRDFMAHNSGAVEMYLHESSACRFDCGNSIGVIMPLHRD